MGVPAFVSLVRADHVIVTPIERVEGTVALTAMVAATQAIIGELTDTETGRTSGQVQQARKAVDLVGDQT
ncbi:hypothetical protein ABZT51_28985 [Streptomyces sp. NPDC005373]|uniref:hypothetical protein n=1 Tax=unclassified Streptomyces TaxID=2593676 RepID=UPI00339F6C4E